MVTERSSERVKFRYGRCLNDNCSKCKAKEVQEISVRKDFVCDECGKPLRECPPPRSWWQMHGSKVIASSAVAVIAIVAGCFFVLSGDSKENKELIQEEPVAQVDTVLAEPLEEVEEKAVAVEEDTKTVEGKVVETPKESAPVAAIPAKSNGKIQLSYGSYSGDIKNGYPHGQGRLTYSAERQINRYDMKKRTAKAGQYVIGEFERGFFIQGRLYSADGELLESVMIGTAPGNAYESK